MAEPSWGIVSTVDEPAQLVIAFVAYHLAIGASEVHLYLDRANPEAEAVLAGKPGLHLTVCDQTHWDALRGGRRPPNTTTRQVANMEHAYRRAGVNWLLHIDADEFVRDAAQLEDAIEAAPDALAYFKLEMLERVRLMDAPAKSIFDGAFRAFARGSQQWVERVYGRYSKFIPKGFAGQWVGKSLIRTGIDDMRFRIHFPDFEDGFAPERRALPRALYHFDGLTPMHSVLKLHGRFDWQNVGDLSKLPRVGRGAQIRYVRNNRMDGGALERLVHGIQYLTPTQAAELDVRGLLLRAPFDPTPQLAQMGMAPDLSVAAFDAALRVRMPERIAETAFAEEDWGA